MIYMNKYMDCVDFRFKWLELAREELAYFISMHPERVIEFEMRTYSNTSADPNYQLTRVGYLGNCTFVLMDYSPVNLDRSENFIFRINPHTFSRKYNSEDLAWAILNPSDRGWYVDFTNSGFSNSDRNRLVNDLKQRTGFDLKGAVSLRSKSRFCNLLDIFF